MVHHIFWWGISKLQNLTAAVVEWDLNVTIIAVLGLIKNQEALALSRNYREIALFPFQCRRFQGEAGWCGDSWKTVWSKDETSEHKLNSISDNESFSEARWVLRVVTWI